MTITCHQTIYAHSHIMLDAAVCIQREIYARSG